MRLGTAIEKLVENYNYAVGKEWVQDKVAWALYHTWKEADDRKTENSSEIPNNCEHITEDGVTCAKYPACDDCLDNPLNKLKGSERLVKGNDESTISKMEQVDKDINVRSKDCETCKHYKLACELFSEICKYEPTTQTETQNSNLTFKTLEYCDICDHKGCKECIANALDEHCMPSQFNKQIEDECAKEYEELGLKELKELIEADRKTEPTQNQHIQSVESVGEDRKTEPQTVDLGNGFSVTANDTKTPNYCATCKYKDTPFDDLPCDMCKSYSAYEPKDEPQTDCPWKQ